MSVAVPQWIDSPSTLHGGAGIVAFADSHAEVHKWADPSTRLTGSASIRQVSPTNPDWRRLTEHTTTRAQ